ncbi:MAG: argininosuccinate lyase [Candidatus Sumerlaeia bacterium]
MARKAASSKTARPIWAKRTGGGPSPRMLAYCAGRDVAGRPAADEALIPYDIWTNRAHCLMLARRGIIDKAAQKAIAKALDQVEARWRAGKFRLDPRLEDVHINIERAVAAIAGEDVAGVMHTARSRNDQSATDVRLWLRDRLLGRIEALAEVVGALAAFAKRHAATVAPGFTHGQPAMPTSLGHWAAAHAYGLARDAFALETLWPMVNQSPLGAAASFGTSWPIDREMSAKLLGFERPVPNSLDAISTRWEAEARLASTLAIMMTHLSSLGQDLIFHTTPPRHGLRLSQAHVTGSSIMPNKRNPDFAEVTRARAVAVAGLSQMLATVGRGALSGYNRDTQWTKYWIMDLLDEVGEAPELFGEVVEALEVDKAALAESAAEGFSLAADLADRLARTRKIPFRRAYHVIAESVMRDEPHGWITPDTFNDILAREGIAPLAGVEELAEAGDPARAIAERVSMGGPQAEDVLMQAHALAHEAKDLRARVAACRKGLDAARKKAQA